MTDAEPAEHDSLLGTRIDGRYSVHREIGRGGMGVVYEGVHDDLGRPVAVKVLNLAWASDPTAVARFLREARTASSFSHGNIVDVTDLGRLPDGRPYLIMPMITGIDLAAMLTESGAQPAKRVAQLLVGVAAALDLIHAKGFVHRDIKPENLMYVVREDGSETVMLLDFGIAAAVMSNEPRLTGQGAIFGTPQFMPPEVCSGGMPDARGDVYALATVAFELITGVLPFGDDNMMRVLTAKLTSDPPTLSVASGVPFPAEVEAVIARGLARAPRDRFAHASEFITALSNATDHAPVSWRSGVLRPSTRSAAHPVGSHPGAYPGGTPISGWPASNHAISNQPSGNDRIGSPPAGDHPISSQPGADHPISGQPGSHWPFSDPSSVTQRTPSQPARQHVAPQAQDAWARRASEQSPQADRSGRPSAREGWQRRPTEQDHWAQRASAEDPWARSRSALGAGLRASERQRNPTTMVERHAGGKRVAALLGIAALLLGFLWYRHNRGLGLDGRDALLPPLAAERRAAEARGSGSATAHAEAPSDVARPAPAPANAAPFADPRAAMPGARADDPSIPAAAAPPVTGAGVERPAPNAHAAETGAALQGAPPSAAAAEAANGVPNAAAPVAAAIPSAAVQGGAPIAAAKPNHSARAPSQAPAPKPGAVSPEPPAPRDIPSGEEPTAPSSPVLVVQEEEPPPPEEVPDLPVRSAQTQAALLAKEASTALLAGEVGRAIELLREATRLDPDQSLAWRTMGLAFERSGDTQAALAAYRQYIRLAPHGPQADMVRARMSTLEQQ